MTGKPGMTGAGLGGRREGAGRRKTRFIFRLGDVYVMRRRNETENWRMIAITPSGVIFECDGELITLQLRDQA